MKATNRHDLVKAIAFLVSLFCIFILFSCNPQDEPVPPVIKKNLSVVKIGIAENVKISSAKLNAIVVPNEDNTSVAFEYQTTNSTWLTKVLPTKFSGKDSIKVTFDLSDLQANTVYNFRLRAVNTAGDTVSTSSSFKTYAVADYDGNLYHTVTIGNQTWLQENLKTTHFANGDVIPNVKDQAQWSKLTTPAYCYYNNDEAIGTEYGALYNWYVVTDPRGLIKGFHTPAIVEFTKLRDFLGGEQTAAGKVKESGFKHWLSPNTGATNSSEFTALPGGVRQEIFSGLGTESMIWSSTKQDMGFPTAYDNLIVNKSAIFYAGSGGNEYSSGLSARLVKD